MTALAQPKAPETKEDRRLRILACARQLMGEGGFEGLSLRKLAAAAQVTVPTIYNLIGGKDQILFAFSGELIKGIERALEKIDEDRPLEKAEAVVIVATGEIEKDPDFHRAALLAGHYFDRSDIAHQKWRALGRRAATMQENAARAAQKIGLMEGNISARLLGDQIFRNYQSASSDWAHRRISLEEFRHIALLGVYLYFSADATPEFRKVLAKKINALETN